MLMEMARMSTEDGLVMQLHPGSLRNHNDFVFARFGLDKGADIPVAIEYTRSLWPLLNRYGSDPRLTLILFTLDESTYTRELALSPDSIRRKTWTALVVPRQSERYGTYFDQVMERPDSITQSASTTIRVLFAPYRPGMTSGRARGPTGCRLVRAWDG